MMRMIDAVCLGFLALVALPRVAQAERFLVDPVPRTMAGPMFAVAPVADMTLADVRGGQSPLTGRLTVGTAMRMVDDNSRAYLRQTGSLARTEMDVWWGSTGSEMIAQNVRAAGGQ